ncbi:MAG: type 2 lanthipeptide synthetase LanM [Candidatus Nanopelagicales bacterium]|nr:type 2 lanthipeptide synthetase LanM [Candidatus Nanopelagicales bacterium]MDZ4249725.1 type 2 lanthipeptide synthetase LanM [Candidatus Nanopelagicales bacterium]
MSEKHHDDGLGGIAAAARSLAERLELQDPSAHGGGDPDRVTRWKVTSARGDADLFAERLAAIGLDDPARLDAVFDDVDTIEVDGLPDWLLTLRGAASRCGDDPGWTSGESGHRDLSPELLPEFVEPLVRQALDELNELARVPAVVTQAAFADLIDGLRRHLAGLIQTCVDTEYRRFRGDFPGMATGEAGEGPAKAEPPDANPWETWTGQLRTSGLFDLWASYPVLARLVGTAIRLWVARTAELLIRLESDWSEIGREIARTELKSVTGIETGLSDPHAGHSSVAVLRVESTDGEADRILYKPKDIASEILWADVVTWMNLHGLDMGPPLRVLAGDGYGWVEFARTMPVETSAEAKRFYRRSGSLAAAIFALGGNDCHSENFVARGAQPVLIDTETIVQPIVGGENDAVGAVGASPTDSVLDQLVLPRWLPVGNRALDVSALGAASSGVGWNQIRLVWDQPGTADAHVVRRSEAVDLSASALVRTGHGVQQAADYAVEVQAGFRDAWGVIAKHGADLLAGPLARLDDLPVRTLVRMTRTYFRVIDTSMQPSLLRNGMDRSIHIEHLVRSVVDREDRAQSLALVSNERDQLENGDVPVFVVSGSDLVLSDGRGHTLLSFTESAAERARRRIRVLTDPSTSAMELRRQSDLISASLAVAPREIRKTILDSYADRADELKPARRGDVAAAANRLADQLLSQIDRGPGRVVGLSATDPQQWSIDSPDVGLYDGGAGIGLALLAAGRALKRGDLADAADLAMAPGVADAFRRPRRLWMGKGIGGQGGVGGLLYAWSVCQRLRNSPADESAAMEDLLRAADTAVLDDAECDLLAGSLGLLAGMIAAERSDVPAPEEIRDRTVRVVDESVSRYLAACANGSDIACNGFSHGDSGYAVVLLAAADHGWGQPDRLLEMARACMVNESERFSPQLRDWPDLRPGAGARPTGPGWCNGLPGIGLSRAIARNGFATVCPETVALDLARVDAGLGRDTVPRDTLCCGTAGRAEILRFMLRTGLSDRRSLYDAAVAGLASRTHRGEVRLGVPDGSPLQPLGLFQGISGVLLALAGWLDPELPDVLTWT